MSIKYKGRIVSFIITGESHSKEMFIEIKRFPKEKISLLDIKKELSIRNTKMFFNTQRKEDDEFEILTGIKNERINKNKIVAKFYNKDSNKENYKKITGFLRPNQSDYAQLLKNKEIKSGAGEFSGRMTLPIVFAGSIAKTILKEKGIIIASRIKSIMNLEDKTVKDASEIIDVIDKEFPALSEEFKEKAFDLLKEIKNNKDSVGSKIETVIIGMKPGYGNKYFERTESNLSKMIFSIPTIKAVEFGIGTEFSKKFSSEVLDEFVYEDERIKTKTNNCGGINGGVTNGMPIIITSTTKPIATISKPTTSLNYLTKQEETKEIEGNHDVFIGNRIIPVIESVIAIEILDEIIYEETKN